MEGLEDFADGVFEREPLVFDFVVLRRVGWQEQECAPVCFGDDAESP